MNIFEWIKQTFLCIAGKYEELIGVTPETVAVLTLFAKENNRDYAVAFDSGEVFNSSNISIKREAERRFHK
ncbi:MAG: hypothetical protein J6T77_06165 [Clostridia bacterium]|nr:hypothetical protein [Clostridia bacterium]